VNLHSGRTAGRALSVNYDNAVAAVERSLRRRPRSHPPLGSVSQIRPPGVLVVHGTRGGRKPADFASAANLARSARSAWRAARVPAGLLPGSHRRAEPADVPALLAS